MLFDPSRKGDAISSYLLGRQNRSNEVVRALATQILKEKGRQSDGNFAVHDPSHALTERAWLIASRDFTKDEENAYPEDWHLVRCPACMLARPSGFVQCCGCADVWLFVDQVVPDVGATPLSSRPAQQLTARDVTLLAEHGYHPERVEVLDIFPQTHHVETVTRFVVR